MKVPAFKSYFEARDYLDVWLLNAPVEISRSQLVVFNVLLAHTIFKAGDDYGRVDSRYTRQDKLADLTSYSDRQVRRALKGLEEEAESITRAHRRDGKAGSLPDEIRVTWAPMYQEASRT